MDSSARRRALIVLAVVYLTSFASGGLQQPLTSTAMHRAGLSMSEAGWMWGARSAFAVLQPLVWGVLSDRAGDARRFAALSLAIGAVLLLWLSSVTSAVWAVAIFALYGMLGPTGTTIDGMVLTALGPDKHRFGDWRVWGTVGYGATSLGSSLLLERHAFEPVSTVVFPICAALTGVGCVVMLFAPRVERPKLKRTGDIIPVLRKRDVQALLLVGGLLWSSHLAYASFITPLAEQQGLPEWSVGTSICAGLVVEAFAFRYSSIVLSRLGTRRTLIGAGVATTLRWALLAVTTSPWVAVALHALHGVSFGLMYATLVAMLSRRVPEETRQTMQGVLGASAFGVGGAFGAVLAGRALDHGGPQAAWLSMAGLAAAGTVVAFITTREEPT